MIQFIQLMPAIACVVLLALPAAAFGQTATTAPSLPAVVHVVEQLAASNSLTDVEQVLNANAAIVANASTDLVLTSALQGAQLTNEQRTVLTLAQQAFRDTRAGGTELAAETLGVRVAILELMAAPTTADVRAVLVKRRDVTGSPQLNAAFARILAQPGVNAAAIQEIAAAFRESNQSIDAALDRLVRLAGGGSAGANASPGSSPSPSTGRGGAASSPLAGHWRCTTIAGGGDASITTDHHMVLNEDGTYRSWQHSFNAFSGRENTTPADAGRWTVRGGALVFTGADGSTVSMPFQRSGDTILLPNEVSRRIWERVR